MSSPVTLRDVCIEKAGEMLSSGVWEDGEGNPFAYMPTTVVQDLLSCTWSGESVLMQPEGFPCVTTLVSRASIEHSRLLLTSGRLEHVALPLTRNEEDYTTMLRMLSRGCQNLRTLYVRHSRYEERVGRNLDAERVLQKLLHNCANLEHLHSGIYFDPNDLRNCRNLKTLRLHTCYSQSERFFRRMTSDFLKRLGSIEVFAFCSMVPQQWSYERNFTRAILDKCPQLTFLGHLDSSEALKELHNIDMRTLGTPRRYQLRRCHWEAGRMDRCLSEYCDTIRAAALSCPLVEILKIRVLYAGSLQYLKALSNLTYLHIEFSECRDGYYQEFFSLLHKIGPQLRHLCVITTWGKSLILNAVCRNCPNLSTLDLDCRMTAEESVEPWINLQNLKRLSLSGCDEKGLLFLLTNCLHLKVLCLSSCKGLEDGLMQAILEKNPFPELEMVLVDQCSLSKPAWRGFIKCALNLTKCCLQSNSLGNQEVMRCVWDLNPSVICLSKEYFPVLKREQFSQNPLYTCWLNNAFL